MKFLPDVNVIFPLLLNRHVHRAAALAWFDAVLVGEVALCRLVRLGVLRLLSTPQVMGPDALTPTRALHALAVLEADERVVLVHEPDDLDAQLEKVIARCTTSPNLWSDAYLAAFARTAGLKVVSFDRGFRKFASLDYLVL